MLQTIQMHEVPDQNSTVLTMTNTTFPWAVGLSWLDKLIHAHFWADDFDP